jgi:hypothetical protein
MLERFRADHGDNPHNSMQAIHIKALMDEVQGGPHPKRNWLKHLSGTFLYAEEEEMIRIDNPGRAFKRPTPPKTDGFHSWTDAEIAQFRRVFAYRTVPRLVMELAVETSARRGDVTRLSPEQMANGRFEFQHHKNGVDVSFPVSGELQAAIGAIPKTNYATFLHTKAGNARSADDQTISYRGACCSHHRRRTGHFDGAEQGRAGRHQQCRHRAFIGAGVKSRSRHHDRFGPGWAAARPQRLPPPVRIRRSRRRTTPSTASSRASAAAVDVPEGA